MSTSTSQKASIEASSTIEIEGYRLAVGIDAELRIRDLELAERLEFADPITIRKLIRRHITAGNINPHAVIATMEITGGRPAREFWLTEAEALFIATQSETPKATAVTQEMIRVFMLARRGMLPQQGNDSALANAMLVLASLTHDVATIKASLARTDHPLGMLGKVEARKLLNAIKSIAAKEVDKRVDLRGYLSAITRLNGDVRAWASLPSRGRWDMVDASALPKIWQRLGRLEAEASARFAAAERLRQTTLFPKPS